VEETVEFDVGSVTLLLLVASVVAIGCRRLRLPYSVGLVAAGLALAFFRFAPQVELTRELIFTAILPPLLFEAALNLNWARLKQDFLPIVTLATLGVVLAGAVTAAGMHWAAGWGWMSALIFGSLIAATDPVSVIATFKEAGTKGRLLVLIEAESLLNDGTAAVAFGVVIALSEGMRLTATSVSISLLTRIGGGVLCGAGVAWIAILLAGRTTDHLIETMVTAVAAYGSFLLADRMGFSGVLATITAGLVMANGGPRAAITERGREAARTFWEFAAFVANSMVFLLIGLHEAQQPFASFWRPAVAAIVLVTLGRALSIYPCCLLFHWSKWKVSAPHQHVLFWGGLRGAMALALALGLPQELPHGEEILTVCFAVVAFSVFVQGLTIRPFLRWMGELPARAK
jgi:CPA1 family monovalent cation:H+ antiporter